MTNIDINVKGDTANWLRSLAAASGWTLDQVAAELFRCAQELDEQRLFTEEGTPTESPDVRVLFDVELAFDPANFS